MSTLPGFEATEEIPVQRSEWFGMWPGYVVDTADPDKNGRVRVRVPQVFGDTLESEFIEDDKLPWARPAFPTHDLHVPEVGDGVWVSFYGGLSNNPIWHGQFLGTGDAPAEFTSAYTPTPKTRIIRTANGHLIEMRWVDGEEKIRIVTAGGSAVNLRDDPAGAVVEALTLGGRKLTLDDAQQLVRLETTTQSIEILDASGVVNVNAATNVNVNADTNVNVNAGALVTVTSPAVDVIGTGQVTFKGVPCLLGPDGARFSLMMDTFIAFFNTHVHGVAGTPPVVPATAVLATTSVKGN